MIKKNNALKTAEEHLEYLEDSIKLMLWFSHYWAMEHPDEDFTYILEERVDIFNKTDLNKSALYDWNRPEGNPDWKMIMEKANEIKESLSPEAHDEFEARIVSKGAFWSSCLKTFFFKSRFSKPASTTKSAPLTASARLVVPFTRPLI